MYSKKFDKISLNKKNIQLSKKEIVSITEKLDPKIKQAILVSIAMGIVG